MGISFYKIKKWTNMLRGKSVHHVDQREGRIYSVSEIKGYYNDLTEKVTRFGLETDEVPMSTVDSGKQMYFPIEIFQYGLAAYDLYLLNNDESMLKKAIACGKWALDNQQENGGWITFAHKNKDHPYSSMAQGEAMSLLVRLNIATGDSAYLECAEKAKTFMLLSKDDGGVCEYADDDMILYEFTAIPVVLNGWIFSIWGLYDYYLRTGDEKTKSALDTTLASLKKHLPSFDIKYWSKYDAGKNICSPFYHKLHIAQLNVTYNLFGDEIYKEYAEKWKKYQNSFWKPKKAFIKKSLQKIFER